MIESNDGIFLYIICTKFRWHILRQVKHDGHNQYKERSTLEEVLLEIAPKGEKVPKEYDI